jgi:hypothetical protein
MKARTTSTQPRSTGGDQAGRAADFIDSIGHLLTSQHPTELVSFVPEPDVSGRNALLANARVGQSGHKIPVSFFTRASLCSHQRSFSW